MTTGSLWMIATIATTTACTNLDHDVVPDVVEAKLAVDRNSPDDLATVDITLRLTAGSKADRTIKLWDTWLLPPMSDVSTYRLDLALPSGRVVLDRNEQRVVDLVNLGTTNADLAPLCHQAVDVLLTIRYVDDPMHGFGDVELARAVVACD